MCSMLNYVYGYVFSYSIKAKLFLQKIANTHEKILRFNRRKKYQKQRSEALFLCPLNNLFLCFQDQSYLSLVYEVNRVIFSVFDFTFDDKTENRIDFSQIYHPIIVLFAADV